LRDGRKLKAVIPGGSSAKVFKAGERFKLKRRSPDGKETEQELDMLDLPYDFDSLIAAGSMSGSGAIIVLDDSADIVGGAREHRGVLRARKLWAMHALPRGLALDV